MPSEQSSPIAYLLPIRDNIVLARSFVDGFLYEQFRDSQLVFYAVTRALEIISEAVRRLPPELRARHPYLPWRAIMGVGNIYRHNYHDVAEQQVWRTVHEGVPALLAAVAEEIERLKDE